MNLDELERLSCMLSEVRRIMRCEFKEEAIKAKHELKTVMNNNDCYEHGDFITACAICNNIETDRLNMEKALTTCLRIVDKYERLAK